MYKISRLTDETLEAFVELVPYEYLVEYEESDSMFFYGMWEDGETCGIALLDTEIKDVIIKYLNVYNKDSSYIHRFVNTIAYDMYKLDMDRLVWKYIEDDEFDYALLLNNLGFVSYQGDNAVFTFTIKQLMNVEILNKPFSNTVLLSDIGTLQIKSLCAEIIGEYKDYIAMPLDINDYVGDCSVVYLEENVPKGLMILEKVNDRLRIPYIYCGSSNPMAIIDMMRTMLAHAKEKYDEDMECSAVVIDFVLIQIIERLTGISCKYQQIAVKELDEIGENESVINEEFMNLLNWDMT